MTTEARTSRDYSERTNVRPGAQGVIVWNRKLAGRWFTFALVTAGWWGVGETGELHVSAVFGCADGHYPGDRYPVRTSRLNVTAA
jgi:hypothetical protein